MWQVSIHAPVMGANPNKPKPKTHELVSIHAPVMGAKQAAKDVGEVFTFQSTHP